MATIIIGIGEYAVSNKIEDQLKTMALGSCVGVVFYAPKFHAAGMAHIALPDSSISPEKKEALPAYFADTAIPLMIQKFKNLGVTKSSELIVKIMGGGAIMDPNSTFNIGKRNVLAIRKILWKHRLAARKEDVGKDYSRTVKVFVGSGKIIISSPKKGEWNL
jgi:chemotaxis protein CheD